MQVPTENPLMNNLHDYCMADAPGKECGENDFQEITECPVFDALRRPSSVATSSAASTSGSDPHPSTALSVVMRTREALSLRTVHSMIRFTATGNSTERTNDEELSLTDSENRA
ncbi:unnamed protein product [Boreogadus saida]